MHSNRNSDTVREVRESLHIQTSTDNVPVPIPVVETNPKLLRKTNFLLRASRAASGDSTITTTDTKKETYITSIIFSVAKDATCDMANGSIYIAATIDGGTKTLVSVANLTLTAQNPFIVVQFKDPVLIDKGTNILFTGVTYAVGTMVRDCVLHGYTVENSAGAK